jgi:hypothetical protein
MDLLLELKVLDKWGWLRLMGWDFVCLRRCRSAGDCQLGTVNCHACRLDIPLVQISDLDVLHRLFTHCITHCITRLITLSTPALLNFPPTSLFLFNLVVNFNLFQDCSIQAPSMHLTLHLILILLQMSLHNFLPLFQVLNINHIPNFEQPNTKLILTHRFNNLVTVFL